MRFVALLLGITVTFAASAAAAPIVAGTTHLPTTAIQDITLLSGTSLNPNGPEIVFAGISGSGVMTLNRKAQAGSTIAISSVAGSQYFGSHPFLGDYVFGIVGELTEFNFSGSIMNVVQNPADPGYATGQPSSFKSGEFKVGGARFGFTFLSGPLKDVTLYTDPAVPFQFSAPFDGLPPSVGTTLLNSGQDVLNVTTIDGEVVATSSNRRIVVTPEPATLAVFGAVAAVGLAFRRRKRAVPTAGVEAERSPVPLPAADAMNT